MIYCMADIHGNYEGYLEMLKKIRLQDSDTLYVLGDVVDRGNGSMKILQDMMLRYNVIPLLGNHEYMAVQCLGFLMKEITEDTLENLEEGILQGLLEWQRVGGQETIAEFQKLSYEEKLDILDYLEEFSLYEEIAVKGREYVLVHAGLDGFSPDKPLDEYGLHELIFNKPDYSKEYFVDRYLVTGHTPTRMIDGNSMPDYIYKGNHHIAIDCGSGYGGRLGAICLDTGEEFYVNVE